MPLYHGRRPDGARVEAFDPVTGKRINGVAWADTDWGLLKIYRLRDPSKSERISSCETMLEFDRNGKARFVLQFDVVRRNFDLVDKRTHITLHRIRVVGDNTYDLTRSSK